LGAIGGAAWFPFISDGGFCAAGCAACAKQTPVKSAANKMGRAKLRIIPSPLLWFKLD
jgi:hypothetical protein